MPGPEVDWRTVVDPSSGRPGWRRDLVSNSGSRGLFCAGAWELRMWTIALHDLFLIVAGAIRRGEIQHRNV